MGGEKNTDSITHINENGSPPRGRGKDRGPVALADDNRITPAWAGKRDWQDTPGAVAWDHPRVGGEKAGVHLALLGVVGSPPRGRGKAQAFRVRPVGRGITPAWAGKRSSHPSGSSMAWDHPRVGGEKSFRRLCWVLLLGSPPRGRGKAWLFPRLPAVHRITPAWAGKSP